MSFITRLWTLFLLVNIVTFFFWGRSLAGGRKSPLTASLKARTHLDEYRRTLFASVFQRVFCVHTQAIFADDEPSEHANSFPDIRWRLM